MADDVATRAVVIPDEVLVKDRTNEYKPEPVCLFQLGPRPYGERITPMLGVLCGLAIATGMAQVSPRLFGYVVDVASFKPWYFKSTVFIALLTGLADVMMTFLPPRPRSQPIIIILSIFTLILVFMLFVYAHRIGEFATVFAFLCLSFLTYGCLVWKYDKAYVPYDYTLSFSVPESRPADLGLASAMWFRILCLVMSIIAVILCFYGDPNKKYDPFIMIAIAIMTIAIVTSWVFVYREMERQV